MKKNNLYHVLQYFAIAGGLLLAGCNQEMEISPEAQNRNNLQIKLTPDFAREVEVKSVNGVDENTIYNVWVIQLKGNDVLTGDDGSPLAEEFTKEKLTDGENGSKIINTTIDVTADKVYFIANTPSNVSFSNVTNKTDIEAKVMDVTGENSLAGGNGIVMSGAWKAGGDKAITEGVDLHRAVAKVTLTVQAAPTNTAESFALTSVRVMNVPGRLQYFRDPDECIISDNSQAYPALTDIANDTLSYPTAEATDMQPLWTDANLSWMPTEGIKGKELTSGVKETFWWYIPENARGKGTGTTQEEKDGKHAPDEQNGEYCTYILIKGYYKHYNGLVSEVDYKVYLGENNINDYNVIRNTHYQVTATIKSASAVDTRINEVTPENYIDYTDNSMPWGLFADKDEGRRNLGSLQAPNGWEIPTKKDMMLAWIYKLNTVPDFGRIYWVNEAIDASGNPVTSSATQRWSINMDNGTTILGGGGTSEQDYVLRTIKTISGFKYPYVQKAQGTPNTEGYIGDIIVSRDENGGVKPDYIRDPNNDYWDATPDHDERDEGNIVAAKFEIHSHSDEAAKELKKSWEAAQKYCEDLEGDWRMPTQRELMLMYILNNQLSDPLLTTTVDPETGTETGEHVFYWSATKDRTQVDAEQYTGWSVCFCNGEDNAHFAITGKTEGYNINTENYIRCVRDVK